MEFPPATLARNRLAVWMGASQVPAIRSRRRGLGCDTGFHIHDDGASSVVPGLYFCGVHFLRKRKSSLLQGFGEDAIIVPTNLTERRRGIRR